MKTVLLMAASAVILLAGFPVDVCGEDNKSKPESARPLTDHELDEEYARAVVLLSAGQFDEAAKTVAAMRRQQPGEPRLIHLERKIQLAREEATREHPAASFQQRLSRIIIPAANFREAEARDIIQWLQVESADRAPDGKPVNFVWLVPSGVELPKVTLNLRQLPLLDLVRYVTMMTGLKYRLEPHALVIYQPDSAAATQPARQGDDVRPQ